MNAGQNENSGGERPIRILCVSGSGRSGTTILSILLSQNNDVFNLGQSRDFSRAYVKQAMCTCDKKMGACDIWSNLVQDAFGGWQEDDFRNVNEMKRKFFADAVKLNHWGPSESLNALREKHREYLDFAGRFLTQCRAKTGNDVFVDTSKSPESALAYSLLDGVEVYVLNLVRDPRAVACSWAKKLGNEKKALRYCNIWLKRHHTLKAWGQSLGARYRVLGYESFVKKPEREIADILTWIGVNANTDFFVEPNKAHVSWARQHLFPPANENVLREKKTDVVISAPTAWRSWKNWRLHWRALKHTHPDGLQYILRSALG